MQSPLYVPGWLGLALPHSSHHTLLRKQLRKRVPASGHPSRTQSPFVWFQSPCFPHCPINPGTGMWVAWKREGSHKNSLSLCLKPKPDPLLWTLPLLLEATLEITFTVTAHPHHCLSDLCLPSLVTYYCPFLACGLLTPTLLSLKRTTFLPTSGP